MFDKNFLWGTASSSYQIEGAFTEDGKGLSIWDTFSNKPGNIAHDENGNKACDHYHRYREDISLMKNLGIQAYRFSISWSRIFPDGIVKDSDGNIRYNKAGLDFYDNIVNFCLENNIKPFITIYHWDLPQALEDKGGWLNRETAFVFADYAEFICKHFSDRVTNIATINEPQIISGLGYMLGLHAPGKKLDTVSVLSVIHHLALAHGLAVTKMRAVAKQPVKIGFSSTGGLCYPSKECDEDIDAARAECFNIVKGNMTFNHTIFCDMTCLGRYPDIAGTELHLEPGLEKIGHYEELPFVKKGDIELIHQPIDYLGINVYNGHEINAAGYINKKPGSPRTALGWPVTPGVMNYGIRYLYERYNLPIYIFEDGLACNDIISLDGKVHDSNRIDFLTRYLTDLEKAYKAGVPILGYFHWSFTDNFEWHSGYDPRFGLVFVDYETQQRIPKDSAYWYSDLIKKSSN
ncbi:GH1 family beta-glucosidase [Lachnospira eligens]|uniref:Beta-glucosidase n=1 Tax=Lachnospira eligens (strain ATCC 27750 / DSM 3376 / VPI C15-48 / C15-B4) TaxID=515620 RepID=C4Z6T5_LACE2|nr:GH1 family beta-glucosidase [Lachnospira eligens]ACR73677.1 Glycoside Hydrolase Family 1 candidate b-glucosidase [[Eubacterium] eligens ATCC 27750]